MKNAPILLFVYKRPNHTRLVLESLSENLLASESDLFVFFDGPKSENDLEDLKAVQAVLEEREWGFKSITKHVSEINKGLANSIISGVDLVFESYSNLIVVEDDLITSKYFLKYMNDALVQYQSNENVSSISGYMYPVNQMNDKSFFLYETGCWGWATWKDQWNEFNADSSALLDQIVKSENKSIFNYSDNIDFEGMLKAHKNGKNDSWAIRWYASAFLKNKLTLFPNVSLVNNVGHDNSGEHCESTSIYDVEVSKSPVDVSTDTVTFSESMYKEMVKYYEEATDDVARPSTVRRIINFGKNIVNRIVS